MDSSEFQRLRFVLQNSTAYLTYPSNVNTRFAHSVGVMHVAGELFLHSLINSRKEDLESFLTEANDVFRHNAGDVNANKYMEQWQKVDNHPAFSHVPYVGEALSESLDGTLGTEGFSRKFIIDTLWEVVRIGALVHDIGHFPMSHVFEFALGSTKEYGEGVSPELSDEFARRHEEYSKSLSEGLQPRTKPKKTPDLHEVKGLHIFFGLKSSQECGELLEKNPSCRGPEYYRFILKLVGKVLLSSSSLKHRRKDSSKDFRLFSFLHSIFANDFIDADRIDYTIRDPHVSGVSMENVDVKRIYDATILCMDDCKLGGESFPVFKLSFHIKALSSIEMFFHQRFLLYRDIIYHHNVSRMNALLILIIRELLYLAINGGKEYSELQRVMADLSFYDQKPKKLNQHDSDPYKFLPDNSGVVYDDSWLRTFLIICLKEIKEIGTDEGDVGRNLKLVSLLETFTQRKVNNLYSIWKRESEFYQWVSHSFERVKADGVVVSNEMQVHDLVRFISEKNYNEADQNPDPKVHATLKIDNFINKSTKKMNELEELSDITILSVPVKPKTHCNEKDESYFVSNDGGELELEMVAPYLHALKDIGAVTPSSSVFVFSENIKSADNSAKKELCVNILKDCFYEYISEVIDIYQKDMYEEKLSTRNGITDKK